MTGIQSFKTLGTLLRKMESKMKFVFFAAVAVILATVVTAYAQVRCYAVCQQGECTQVCIR